MMKFKWPWVSRKRLTDMEHECEMADGCLDMIREALEPRISMDGCPPMFYPEAILNVANLPRRDRDPRVVRTEGSAMSTDRWRPTVDQHGQCTTCGRSCYVQGTFYHYKKFPGCNPHRELPKFDPAHGGYPGFGRRSSRWSEYNRYDDPSTPDRRPA